jgi:hypothetical protein
MVVTRLRDLVKIPLRFQKVARYSVIIVAQKDKHAKLSESKQRIKTREKKTYGESTR